MQGIKPAPGLVNAFGYKICRVIGSKGLLNGCSITSFQFVIIKSPLRIGHGTAIEPYIDQVGHPVHRFTRIAYQYDFVHIRFMQVKDAFVQIMLGLHHRPAYRLAFLISSFSSPIEPMHFSSDPSSVLQIGKRVPQNR